MSLKSSQDVCLNSLSSFLTVYSHAKEVSINGSIQPLLSLVCKNDPHLLESSLLDLLCYFLLQSSNSIFFLCYAYFEIVDLDSIDLHLDQIIDVFMTTSLESTTDEGTFQARAPLDCTDVHLHISSEPFISISASSFLGSGTHMDYEAESLSTRGGGDKTVVVSHRPYGCLPLVT